MKRFIIISIVLAVVLSLGVVESLYCTHLFDDLESRLLDIESSLDDDKENISNDNNVQKINDLIKTWDVSHDVTITFTNHAIMRSLEEKLYALKSSIETNEYVNAKEYVTLARALSRDLIDETHITLGNLF